jgi:two-component system phosphate regulon sensor histidine kinase PhoR
VSAEPVSAVAQQSRRLRRFRARRAALGSVAVKRRVQLALLGLLLLLAGMLFAGILGAVNLYQSAEDHYIGLALPLRASSGDVLFQMEREETGVRGYLITHDRRSLDPYFAGRRGVAADLAQIASLVRNHPEIARRMGTVRAEVRALHGFYDRLIVFVADGRLGQARARREALDGEELADRFRRTASLLQGDTTRLVMKTQREQRATYVRTVTILALAGFVALAIAGAFLVKLPERLRLLYASEEDARLRAEQGANAAQALEHVSDAVFLVDDAGAIRFWNTAGEAMFGIPARLAVGRPAADVVPEYHRLVAAAHEGDRFVPVRIGDEEGWLAPALSEFPGGSVLTVSDATAGYVLERARADFVSTASHELRTPLTAVFGGARTLIAHRDVLGPGQQETLLRMIEQESEHLVQIVDQLLISAQLDRGAVHLGESDVDVRDLCRRVVDSARVRADGRNVILLQMPTEMAALRCDEGLLRQVLVNVVENALKYSPGGARVDVLVKDDPEWVRIDVADEGIGIPATEQERIFEKFYRIDAAMSRGVGGSGLGLYISREIVLQMGGTLTVRSAGGTGSTFSIVLPREPAGNS